MKSKRNTKMKSEYKIEFECKMKARMKVKLARMDRIKLQLSITNSIKLNCKWYCESNKFDGKSMLIAIDAVVQIALKHHRNINNSNCNSTGNTRLGKLALHFLKWNCCLELDVAHGGLITDCSVFAVWNVGRISLVPRARILLVTIGKSSETFLIWGKYSLRKHKCLLRSNNIYPLSDETEEPRSSSVSSSRWSVRAIDVKRIPSEMRFPKKFPCKLN